MGKGRHYICRSRTNRRGWRFLQFVSQSSLYLFSEWIVVYDMMGHPQPSDPRCVPLQEACEIAMETLESM
jgi:hypothetical protein